MQHVLRPFTEKLQQVLETGDPFLPMFALKDLKSVWKDFLLSISQQKNYGWPLYRPGQSAISLYVPDPDNKGTGFPKRLKGTWAVVYNSKAVQHVTLSCLQVLDTSG